jgi:hypothetical protein
MSRVDFSMSCWCGRPHTRAGPRAPWRFPFDGRVEQGEAQHSAVRRIRVRCMAVGFVVPYGEGWDRSLVESRNRAGN